MLALSCTPRLRIDLLHVRWDVKLLLTKLSAIQYTNVYYLFTYLLLRMHYCFVSVQYSARSEGAGRHGYL